MKQAADVDSDVFCASIYNVLKSMLSAADTDSDYRDAVRTLGNELHDDGAWRARVKNSYGLDDNRLRAWDSIAGYIEKNKTGAPWWNILDFADGKTVDAETRAFFTA